MLIIDPATSPETVIDILTEASLWLQSRDLPSWTPATLAPVINAAIARGEVYIARIDNQPVGTISVQWADPAFWGERPDDAGYVHKLAIVRSAAGQHTGGQLLDWAEHLIAAQGRRYARLDCHAENPTINRFYQGAGYQVRGTLMIQNVPFNLYEKPLA
ncbi:MAG: GNAT family N-acetyltransferase [Chloroflexota bacterium]